MNINKITNALLSYEQNPKIYDYIYLDNELYINNSKEKIYIFDGIDKAKLIKNTDKIKDNSIIYFSMGDGYHEYKKVLEFILKNSNKRHVLLADGGDGHIYPIDLPDNILHVYCPNFRFYHPKYSPFPRGILNAVYSKYLELDISKIKKEKLLYCNFSPGNYNQERMYDFLYWQNQNWVKQENNIQQSDYFLNLYKHKFNICTIGSGSGLCHGYPADTYRMYETIMCGCIPIARRHFLTEFLKYNLQLPIFLVNKWEEVTMETLEKEYEILSNNFNTSAITEDYWIYRLRSHF